jgi:hypothetical protein
MYISIQGLPVKLSEKTIQAIRAHKDFCSAGSGWLVKNDPESRLEMPLIQAVDDSIQEDCEAALEKILNIFRDACHGEFDFSNLDKDDYWEQLSHLVV